MRHCCFCDEDLGPFEPGAPLRHGAAGRVAFDSWLGRLWRVCPACGRWNPVPLEDRWETLEACERLARERGRILLEGEHLALLAVDEGQLVRVGEAPRTAFSDWRYSRRLDLHPVRRPGFVARLLASLPERTAWGTDFHGQPRMPTAEWIASPFQEQSGLLTALFLRAPLVERCPSCHGPLAVVPASFGALRLVREDAGPSVVATCALCGETSAVPLSDARPTLRAALAAVDRRREAPEVVVASARLLDRAGGADRWVDRLARDAPELADTRTVERIALAIALDEAAELEALEAEWRAAEEVAAIMDGELTAVPGFEAFRARVLAESGEEEERG